MTRRSRWLAFGVAIVLGAAGALIALGLAGGRWTLGTAAGVVIGALAGSFAPSAYDALVGRGEKREALRATSERQVPQSPARLLDPRRELVEFVGRESELKELQAWCTDKEAGRLRLVTGPGGVGKTRLSVELADRMRKTGWRTERVADGQEVKVIPSLSDARRRRVLLVVDYAETRARLNQMISDLAGERGHGVRVLLLARSAGDWWDRLGVEDPAAWDQVQAAKQVVIDLAPAVSADVSDAEIVAQAARTFATELDMPEMAVDLSDSAERRRVLDLHAAALVAVLGQANGLPVEMKAADVLNELLRHEQHFWYASAALPGLTGGQAGLTQQQIRQLVAAACLLGAATQEEARALPTRLSGLGPSATIADWLRQLYPPDRGEAEWLGSLQPDRLAELHTIRELTDSPELAEACLTGLDARQALRAVTMLARASSDYPEAEDLLRQTLPDVADVIATMPASFEGLTVIYNAIPYPTVVLASAAVSLCQRILGLLPADNDPELRALWLSNLGTRVREVGRNTDALPVTQEAATIRRGLAATSPDRYLPDLALSLDNLGAIYSELGCPTDALPVTQEAVTTYRELAAASPDLYLPDLARSLNNLSVRYSELGRLADALPVTQEAVTIRRELAAASPGLYLPDLARSLGNLGGRYSALGRLADALPVTQEAVTIYRELAAASPDQYRPDLAHSLDKLGGRYYELGRPTDALPVTQEAVTIRRELAAAGPNRYRLDLAASLTNLGLVFSELGRPADALPPAEEAVTTYRELAASPDRRSLDLAASLNNLGQVLSELGRPTDALPPAEEAVAIFRDLATVIPDRYRSQLAEALTRLAAVHDQLRHAADADSARKEATRAADERD